MTKKPVHHYKHFHLSRNEISRIASNLERLARIGKLTREHQFQKKWVGTAIILRLAKYSLEHALEEGTINWDVTLTKFLSMVLGVAHSRQDTIPTSRTVILSSLPSNGPHHICPIKLDLIMALRLGNVEDKNVTEVLQRARARADRTIIWKFPTRPIYCMFKANAVDVVVDTAANTNQLRHTLSDDGQIAGILATLRTHDIRRGAARDPARIPDIKGFATPMTAKALGHTIAAYNNGTTDAYVGAA
ncbi:MAG: hypothetical protein OHK93_008342 [Ramalina farinacea]|uniref:Uncharacterized protein n=1 Tax=Ramalina farinacea TaxID=258253 RepID=A0AA43QPC5_9LECA|nr:hypothetical protein [Ramalina farinacea]